MGFIIGLIVNVVLLSIPIGSTLGTLFGIRPFENDRQPVAKDLNTLVTNSFCDEFHAFAQNKIGQNYTCKLWDMNSFIDLAGPIWRHVMYIHHDASVLPILDSVLTLHPFSKFKRDPSRTRFYTVHDYNSV